MDLLFTDPVYINSIGVCETPISDHNIVYVNTNFDTFLDGVDTVQSSPNPIESPFESLNLLKCDWELLKGELKSIDWDSCLDNSSVT